MNKQITIKSYEFLQDQVNQFKSENLHLQNMIEKYSEKILKITNLNKLPEEIPSDLAEFIENHKLDYLYFLRENKKQPEYEKFLDMQFEKIDNWDKESDVIEISAKDNESQEAIIVKLQKHLKEHCWWLQDYWREKRIPKEQFTITTEIGDIQIYNFSEELTERHIKELEKLIQLFSQAKDKSPLKEIKYILLDNEQPLNPNTGENMNGQSRLKCKALKIYPQGKSFMNHRIGQASNFEGTVIHEFSHNISPKIREEWKKLFWWIDLEIPIQLQGWDNQYYTNPNPERCISEYAKFSPDEDLCESMVAAAKAPETLDTERLAFIQSKIFGNDTESKLVTIKRQKKVNIPKVNQPIKYTIKRQKGFKIG